MITQLSLATARIEPVWIEGQGAEPHAWGWTASLLLACAVALVVGAALVWRYGSWLDRSKARDLAFATLARRLKLDRDEKELLRRIAEAHRGAHPVSVLVSEHAFRAMQRLAEPGLSLEDSRRLNSLAQKAFA